MKNDNTVSQIISDHCRTDEKLSFSGALMLILVLTTKIFNFIFLVDKLNPPENSNKKYPRRKKIFP